MAQQVKVHLVPRAGSMTWSLCATPVREGGRQAVQTREAFNALPAAERCLRCDAMLNRLTTHTVQKVEAS